MGALVFVLNFSNVCYFHPHVQSSNNTIYHSVLSATAPKDHSALVFALVFAIVWVGAAIITINAQLLGGTLYVHVRLYVLDSNIFCRSFFQSVCVVGYCIFPITIAAILCFFVGRFVNSLIFRSVITAVTFAWSTFGMCFRSDTVFTLRDYSRFSQFFPKLSLCLTIFILFLLTTSPSHNVK